MKAKLVKEHITRFEKATSGDDFKRKIGVGRIALIDKWFSDLGISSDRYTIDKNFNIHIQGYIDLRKYLRGTNITSLPDNLSVGGNLDLDGTNITSLPDNLSVGGSLYLRGTKITALPDNLSVGREIYKDF